MTLPLATRGGRENSGADVHATSTSAIAGASQEIDLDIEPLRSAPLNYEA